MTAPTLLIQGEHDQYGTLAQIDAIERGVARSRDACGARLPHAPHLEAPEDTLARPSAFHA